MVPANELHTMNTTTAEGIHDPTLIAELIEHRATQNHIAWVMFYTSTGNGMLHGTLGFSFTDSTTYLCRSADGLSQVTFQASDIRVILNNTIFLR